MERIAIYDHNNIMVCWFDLDITTEITAEKVTGILTEKGR